MIYRLPPTEDAVDQGDVVDSCPLVLIEQVDPATLEAVNVTQLRGRVLVLTQTCDLLGGKTTRALVARIFPAQELITVGLLKASDIRGPLRSGRVFGWYFLPQDGELGLPEMIVDLRQLHTVPLDLLGELCRRGQRRAPVQPLYREHLAKHFADSYSRIGLPKPYETL